MADQKNTTRMFINELIKHDKSLDSETNPCTLLFNPYSWSVFNDGN